MNNLQNKGFGRKPEFLLNNDVEGVSQSAEFTILPPSGFTVVIIPANQGTDAVMPCEIFIVDNLRFEAAKIASLNQMWTAFDDQGNVIKADVRPTLAAYLRDSLFECFPHNLPCVKVINIFGHLLL